MAKQVTHLRDDIRKTFTTYALIPVFIISLISCALAFSYWNKNVLERNYETRVLVSEALTTIISSYMEKEMEIAKSCNLDLLISDKDAQTKMYQELYAHVNVLHANADFYILDKKMNILLSSRVKRPEFLDFKEEIAWGIIGEVKKNPNTPVISFVGDYKDFRNRNLAIGKAIQEAGKVKGYIIFVIPGTYLLQAISNPYVQFVISDRYDYTPIATNYIFSNLTMNKMKPEIRDIAGYFSYEQQKYYMTKEEILDGKLTIYAITPIGSMVSQYTTAVIILLGVLFILTVTIIISVKKQTVEKTKVIDQLVEAFEAVKQGKLDTKLNIKTNNEFEIIAEAYNTMLASLKKLININNEKARETVISEIKQLESQFNPHFLFNTLENIKFMIKLDPNAANKMIVALSALLRYSINNKISEVTIKDDLAYTQNYLDIQKIRFGDRLEYSFVVENEVKKCIVPKLIFQPIIENAIKYGSVNGDTIKIVTEMWCDNEHLEIVIFNTGAGMDEKSLLEIQKILAADVNESQHTGLYNVNRRIKLIYGFDYGLEIQSEKDTGTSVRIVLPIRY